MKLFITLEGINMQVNSSQQQLAHRQLLEPESWQLLDFTDLIERGLNEIKFPVAAKLSIVLSSDTAPVDRRS
jgi:hypothetical protein